MTDGSETRYTPAIRAEIEEMDILEMLRHKSAVETRRDSPWTSSGAPMGTSGGQHD